VDELFARDESFIADVECFSVDVWRFQRQQDDVAQVLDRRIVKQFLAAAQEPHLPGPDFFYDAGQGMPIARAVDKAGPQNDGRQTEILNVPMDDELGLGLGASVSVEASQIGRSSF